MKQTSLETNQMRRVQVDQTKTKQGSSSVNVELRSRVIRTLSHLTLAISAILLTTQVFAQGDPTKGASSGSQVPNAPPAMQAKEGASDVKGTIKMARVYFVGLKDGDTVPAEFTAKFGIEGMKVAPAGEMTPGTGHFHVLIDTPLTPKGEIIPTDAKHLHFGKGQIETKLKLTPGKHTLTLLFADGTHRSYGEAMSQTLTVNVK